MANDVTIDPGAIERLLNDPNGPVAAHLARKSSEVAVAARGRCPVRSGHLVSTIVVERLPGATVAFSVGSRLPYAAFIERRTGFLTEALRDVLG